MPLSSTNHSISKSSRGLRYMRRRQSFQYVHSFVLAVTTMVLLWALRRPNASPLTVPQSSTIEKVDQSKPELDPCHGKEKIQAILRAANLDASNCTLLPKWSDVCVLYGDEPVILGLETCAAYRDKLKSAQQQFPESLERIAGIYNSGTNAVAHFLNLNLKTYENYKHRNVPWGKQ